MMNDERFLHLSLIICRLVEMLHEYTTDVPMEANANATIETKNINVMVVNHSAVEDFHYTPFLSYNNTVEQV